MDETKKRNNGKIFSKIILVLVTFFLGAGGMYAVIYFFPTNFIETKNVNTTKVVKDVSITETGLSESVDKIYDAVVVVETYKNDKLIGSGTGFVYKEEAKKGYIFTNNHVISGGNKVYVTFTNGKKIETEILGSDKYADIAVLSIDSFDDMKVAALGSSEDSKVGDTVFAVGAPLDSAYSWTVTRGILSGKNRLIEVSSSNTSYSAMSDWVMTAVQTDAAINSGNSGGPLANVNGEVIGITSMKLVSSGVEGMGFAIPIEIASHYAEKLEKGEEVIRPYLGVSMYNISEMDTSFFSENFEESRTGVYVDSVEADSPAANAGVKKKDIIIKINDDEVKNVAYLKYYLYKYDVGDKVTLTVLRDDKEKKVEVTLGKNEDL